MAQAGASLRSLALLSLFLTASGIIQQQQSCSIIHTASGQTIRFDAWGQNSVLVQAFPAGFQPSGLPLTALLQRPKLGNSACELQDRFSNGELLVEVENERLVFRRVSDMALLFQESGPRTFEPSGYRVDDFALNVSFSSDENEALYGLGQHKTGRLNYKNLTLPLQPKNTEIFIPLLHSSRGYSYLFDYPGYGTFTSGQNTTAWAAQAAKQMTLWVTTAASNSSRGAIAEAMDTYLDVTGRPPLYPYWTTGFWQSRNRYRTQDEVLSVAREYVNRSLPLSLIVIDYYSWSVLGDETFNPDCWPDPKGLVSELKQLGVNLMVSPYFHEISNTSHRYAAAKSRGLLALDNQTRTPAAVGFGSVPGQAIYLYDVFQEEAREYMWQAVADTYEDYGVAALWLDCDEPCGKIPSSGLSYCRGTCDDVAVGDLYPWLITAAINPHPKASDPIVTLGRSTWAGGQRYGAAVWSGDTRSTFADLNQQFRAGLNVALSGVTYWTTDIGGYSGGNTTDPEFRELIVRWFQWGAFCPLFRLHGCRQRDTQSETNDDCGPASCGDNEVWSFGDTALSAITKVMFLRESLRNYTYQQFSTAVEEGLPVIRPLFLEFPADKQAANIDDEQMFGPDYLVAPIMAYGARGRHVYLPSGSQWTDHFGGQTHAGGQVVVWSGPLDEFPLFKRV